MRFQYAGPGPVTDPESAELIRPGDIRECDEEPAFGPWELLDPPADETPADPPADPPAPAAPSFVTPPAATEGM